MIHVTPKKYLGQHFLKDKNIAKKIVESLELKGEKKVLEIGPGTGILTEFLLKNKEAETWVIEIDKESIAFLREKFPELKNQIIEGDFLKTNLEQMQEP
ncbi:MAG: rRNA adenine N-6-methyltransferase family protein, partial [Bacteroidota bacterium]